MFGSLFFRRVYGLLVGKPMNFSFIDDHVAGSARPTSKREVEWLRKRGVKAVLSLTETPLETDWVEGLVYKHLPMKDHSVPTLDQLREAVDFVISQSIAKQVVLVHCLAGKGRTGTVLAAYMCEELALPPHESISRLRSKRPGSVEKRQRGVVEAFCESLATKK